VLVLLAIGPLGFGPAATITALVLFAIPPILTNGYVGMREVDRDVVEAAAGRRAEPAAGGAPGRAAAGRAAAAQRHPPGRGAGHRDRDHRRARRGGGLGNIILRGFGTQDQAAVVSGALLVPASPVDGAAVRRGARRVLDPAPWQSRGDRSDPLTVTRDASVTRWARTNAGAHVPAGHARPLRRDTEGGAHAPIPDSLRLLAGRRASRSRVTACGVVTAVTRSPRATAGVAVVAVVG
jgi:osmoprotectant transport system permease protein